MQQLRLFGTAWQSDPRWRLYFCAIDLAAFASRVDRHLALGDLNIPRDAFVIGHVGRFSQEKNHRFLIELLVELVRLLPATCLLLVGEGPLRSEVEQQVHESGLSDRVVFAGLRRDVPQLLTNAMDLFLFPSLYEGLPMVLLEAQAAGLPCIISDAIDDDATVIPNLVQKLSLTQPVTDWVRAVVRATEFCPSTNRRDAHSISRKVISIFKPASKNCNGCIPNKQGYEWVDLRFHLVSAARQGSD